MFTKSVCQAVWRSFCGPARGARSRTDNRFQWTSPDISQVLFICTANILDTLPPPLLDRCEVIRLSGYTHDERFHVARCYLLPKQLAHNGLSNDHVRLIVLAFFRVVRHYTQEAGVRALERGIGGVVRFKAVGSTAHVDTRGLPPWSRPSSSTVSDANGALIQRVRNGNLGYDPIIDAD